MPPARDSVPGGRADPARLHCVLGCVTEELGGVLGVRPGQGRQRDGRRPCGGHDDRIAAVLADVDDHGRALPDGLLQRGEEGRAEQACASGPLADLADQALKPAREDAALVSLAFLARRAVGELEIVSAQVRHDDAVQIVPEIFEFTGQMRVRLAQQRKLRAVIDMAVQQDSAPPLEELHGCFRLPGGDRHGRGVGRDPRVPGEHPLLVPQAHAPPRRQVQQLDRERVQAQAHGGLAAAGGKDQRRPERRGGA